MLSAEELFILFSRACVSCGASGYRGASFATQTPQTRAVWQDFRKRLEAYWPNMGRGAKQIVPYELTEDDDYIAAICNALDDKGRHKLYKHLYNLGHRINC